MAWQKRTRHCEEGKARRGDRRECLWCNPPDFQVAQLVHPSIQGIATACGLAMTCCFLREAPMRSTPRDTHWSFDSPCRVQHVFDEDAVAPCGVIHQNMRDCTDEFTVLQYGTSTHE